MFLDRVRGIDGYLVVGAVAFLDAEVVIVKVDVEIGEDQSLADPLPDDPGHFVAIEFDDRVGYLDLAHAFSLFPRGVGVAAGLRQSGAIDQQTEEHTSELQSLMRISYDVFCLQKKKTKRRSQT